MLHNSLFFCAFRSLRSLQARVFPLSADLFIYAALAAVLVSAFGGQFIYIYALRFASSVYGRGGRSRPGDLSDPNAAR